MMVVSGTSRCLAIVSVELGIYRIAPATASVLCGELNMEWPMAILSHLQGSGS